MLASGSLNKRVTVQTPATEQDISGQPTLVFNDILSTWGSIRAANGKEIYAASGFVAQLSHVVVLRYRTDISIKHGMRILYGQRAFIVQAVSDPDESRVMQNLLCLELNDGI